MAWPDILSALAAEKPITSVVLRPLFTGKSVNTTGFLLAALHKERIVEPLKGKTKHFQLTDPAAFLEKVAKLQPGKPDKTPAAKSKEGAVATPTKVSAKPAKKVPANDSVKKASSSLLLDPSPFLQMPIGALHSFTARTDDAVLPQPAHQHFND